MILSRYKPLKDLTPDERVRAVYQHCCLRFVNNKITNNPSLRERFKIAKQNAATASRLLAEAVAAKKIRPVDPQAAGALKATHDRMPVILDPGAEDPWLDAKSHPNDLRRLLVPCADELLDAYEVSPLVNSPAHEAPDCIEKAAGPQ